MTENPDRSLTPLLVHLLNGVLDRDEHPKLWQDILSLQAAAIDFLRVLGLVLIVDEAEGYAFLRQGTSENPEENIPRLIASRPLSYPVSLLCVLLRKKLVEADAGGGELRVILTRNQIVEMLQVFLPHQANEARIIEQIDVHLSKVEDYGFIRKLKGQESVYEVRRILKALVDADWLANFDEKLKVYQDYAARDV